LIAPTRRLSLATAQIPDTRWLARR
jgi:hypothetical protein